MSRKGFIVPRLFTEGVVSDPYGMFNWVVKDVGSKDKDGKAVTSHEGVEVPDFWSDNAAFILSDKYFRAAHGSSPKETSLQQTIDRVVNEIVRWGVEHGYFDKANGAIFGNELRVMIASQKFSFNSPVYFNVGCVEKPQCSACFILVVEDNLDSISSIVPIIVHVFSRGSGCGIYLSNLREAGAPLSRGGVASGPKSFLLGFNSFAGIIKSGGIQRRAAMLARMDDFHPDILDFIEMKCVEERKARALVRRGYTVEDAYKTVAFQNVNLSVGVSDALMKAALEGKDWTLKSVLTGKAVKTIKAMDLLDMIAHCAHLCGDPGIQFDDAMNRANPLIRIARILCTNPCAEFACISNTACNLASLNLAAFYENGRFDYEKFRHSVRISIVAQDILVGMSGYPTPEIEKNSNEYRPLGLGFSNLGGLFLKMGIPYDSEQARLIASTISADMTATAFQASIDIAKILGPFAGFEHNRKAMLAVLKAHKNKLNALADAHGVSATDLDGVSEEWEKVCQEAAKHGVRNCMVTLVPPAGTISNLMDCTTAGIEPLLFSATKRRLDAGGELIVPSFEVDRGLEGLGYTKDERAVIAKYIEGNGTLTGCPIIKASHLPIFDPVYPLKVGDRRVSAMAQIQMMGAVQPFISGSISKTIGLPPEATVGEVKEVLVQAWRLGLKAISFYRANSKMSQPLVNAVMEQEKKEEEENGPPRKAMPREVKSTIHRGMVGMGTPWETKFYIITGEREDGTLGEVFVVIAKEGSAMRALVDGIMTSVSIGLQYGVPLEVLCQKFIGTKFEPSGRTGYDQIRTASSILDYIFKYLGARYLGMRFSEQTQEPEGPKAEVSEAKDSSKLVRPSRPTQYNIFDFCECGGMLYMSGTCIRCSKAGCKRNTQGACG